MTLHRTQVILYITARIEKKNIARRQKTADGLCNTDDLLFQIYLDKIVT